MTPERARELCKYYEELHINGLVESVATIIVIACAEQREADAKICGTRGDRSGDGYEAGGCYGCEIAIREGK
jgi:hypothetical protein